MQISLKTVHQDQNCYEILDYKVNFKYHVIGTRNENEYQKNHY